MFFLFPLHPSLVAALHLGGLSVAFASPRWSPGLVLYPSFGLVRYQWLGTVPTVYSQAEHILDYRGISRPHKPQSTTGSPHSPLNSPLICQRCHLVPPSATIMHPSLVLNLHSKLLIPAFSSSISLYVPDFCDLYPSCL